MLPLSDCMVNVKRINLNFQPVRNNKNRENTRQIKNNYTHKIIFTWFGNLPMFTELQGFHYYRKKYKSAATVFPISQKHGNNTYNKTLITKLRFLHKTGPKNFPGAAWAYWPKSLLHGLSLSKSLIKNHATLFGSDRVVKLD